MHEIVDKKMILQKRSVVFIQSITILVMGREDLSINQR